jgi:hypothetical protein
MKYFLGYVIETFRNRVGLTAMTILSFAVGIITTIFFQSITVNTFQELWDMIQSNQKELIVSEIANLLSGLVLAGVSVFWIKEVFRSDCYDTSWIVSKLTCLFVGGGCASFAFVFFHFLLTKMLAVVIVGAFAYLWLTSDSSDKKGYR